MDREGKKAKIQFDCVSGIEYNNSVCSGSFLKYYVVEKNKYLQKIYDHEMKLPENIRNKDIINEYKEYAINRHRVIMCFNDENAFDDMAFDQGKFNF